MEEKVISGPFFIGTAGWSIPTKDAAEFGDGATALERYATRFKAVEINSSFHRPHRASTWAKWADAVPDDFRFAVKVPKTITHGCKLAGAEELLQQFAEEVAGLGEKLSVFLVQLPPSLIFDADIAGRFFAALHALKIGDAVCEPRNASWFEPEADEALQQWRVHRAAADPAKAVNAGEPGGWSGLAYYRLHGSPVMYRSSYDDAQLQTYARAITAGSTPSWCMFDNTASSAATGNAISLLDLVAE